MVTGLLLTPPYSGVTVMVDVTGAPVVLEALKEGILPVPLPAKPMDVLLFVQLKLVPITLPLKFIAAVAVLLHNVWLATLFTSGTGFTVIVKTWADAVQPGPPVTDGVTVIVATCVLVVVFKVVKAGISPVPLDASPIDGLSLVQLKVAPLVPVKLMAAVGEPTHSV